MPITLTGRSINTGNLSPMIPIVANNPAFQVKIMPVDGRLEEKPRQKQDTAEQEKIKVGDYIVGEELSETRKKGKKVSGQVIQVQMGGEDVTGYKILDGSGDEVIVDPTTAVKADHNGQVGANESFVLTYENWLLENAKLEGESKD
jgi:hypothetical protein